MVANHTFDDVAYYRLELTRHERELAALVRQYGRAAEVNDGVALEVEAEAFCDRVRWLLYNHLGLRIGMASDEWVWLDGQADCRVEALGTLELRAAGRFDCSLPEGRRQWTGPFEAMVSHSPIAAELRDYTIWLGNRATLLNVSKVRQRITSGEMLSPPAPVDLDEWAFVFRRGDRA